ncbi:ECF RNA polymerase sigma factor SigE [Posidoniimonas polymericola]|uniref:ECF RNA polymerase sigma factor SigE n=1 Tax=Posidoniimonas polymericola TaxID=2528002 RepID=A0A5C5ZEY5_9BACT|nr:sigma-70 family RNA polymerase sigma factor [Posidoniimonas polymericola]TWT85607.1 ECF RNA polymerase sigma factor SigE [Posidoniimonas polymericola]
MTALSQSPDARASTALETPNQTAEENADAPPPASGSAAGAISAAAPDQPLAELVRQHQAGVWRLLRYLGADAAEADDLTQETFLALARSRFQHQTTPQTAAYLRTAARNQLLMLRRKQQRQVSTVALEAAEAVWAERIDNQPNGGWQAFTAALRACTEQLEGRAALAIDLAYRQSLGREQIADRLDMKPAGVKTLLRRTRAVLRECIERRV